MDLSNALLLVTAVYGLVDLAKAMLPAQVKQYRGVVVLIVLAISFGSVFLVGATSWANEQVIGTVSMDLMSTADKILVSFLVAGAAVAANKVVSAIPSIGENNPPSPAQAAQRAGRADG
jgi:hypothetical protein